jgi:hypothetical protein
MKQLSTLEIARVIHEFRRVYAQVTTGMSGPEWDALLPASVALLMKEIETFQADPHPVMLAGEVIPRYLAYVLATCLSPVEVQNRAPLSIPFIADVLPAGPSDDEPALPPFDEISPEAAALFSNMTFDVADLEGFGHRVTGAGLDELIQETEQMKPLIEGSLPFGLGSMYDVKPDDDYWNNLARAKARAKADVRYAEEFEAAMDHLKMEADAAEDAAHEDSPDAA